MKPKEVKLWTKFVVDLESTIMVDFEEGKPVNAERKLEVGSIITFTGVSNSIYIRLEEGLKEGLQIRIKEDQLEKIKAHLADKAPFL
jgi:hypothetical protein